MDHAWDLNRRTFLTGAGALVAGGLGAKLLRDRDEAGLRAEVFIARAESYTDDLAATIRAGLAELGFGPAWVAGKSVLLKPNLVEPSREAPQINTHPAVIRAAAEVFRSWGARDVFVAEGQGHCRDSDSSSSSRDSAPSSTRPGSSSSTSTTTRSSSSPTGSVSPRSAGSPCPRRSVGPT